MISEEITIEEAINMLKSKMDGHTDTSYEWAETIRMAIRALEVVQGMAEVFLQELTKFDIRDVPEEERNFLKQYINSISKSTGIYCSWSDEKMEDEEC